ncbi:hypothetical protein [Oceanobacter antarcticus]|uniref:Beta/Gamma crystallin n=1 Tax=Oceanobacter antarcticus TaxID=3133425 RepID=A0ABW8NGV1_9GAMM
MITGLAKNKIVFIISGLLGLVVPIVDAEQASEINIQELVSGNSLVIINRFGSTLTYFYNDGSAFQFNKQGASSKAIWSVKNDSLCTTVTSVPKGYTAKEYCLKIPQYQLGRSWMGHDPKNGTITYKFVEGHPDILKLVEQ